MVLAFFGGVPGDRTAVMVLDPPARGFRCEISTKLQVGKTVLPGLPMSSISRSVTPLLVDTLAHFTSA
jgi:hypothetical protein